MSDTPAPPAPLTYPQMLDKLDARVEEACTSCREVREKVLAGKSALAPVFRHTGDVNFTPPVVPVLDRLVALEARLVALTAELGEIARSF